MISTEISVGPTADWMMGIASITNWITSFIVTIAYLPMKNCMGTSGVFWFYGACCILSAVFIWLFVPETQNKKIEDIHEHYTSSNILNMSFK